MVRILAVLELWPGSRGVNQMQDAMPQLRPHINLFRPVNPADGPHALRDLLDFYREVLHRATPRIIVGYPNCGRDMILVYRASNGSDRDTILCGKRAWRHYIRGLTKDQAKPDALRHEVYSMTSHWTELRNLTTHYAPSITVRQT